MRLKSYIVLALLALGTTTGCDEIEPIITAEPTHFNPELFAQGLTLPIGMSFDGLGRAWVTESGTGNNDARVSLITKEGQVYPVITGFASLVANGSVEGIGHLLYQEGLLYVLEGATGMLYTVNVASFKPGDAPLEAKNLPKEDIGTFVKAQLLTNPINTNIYNLTLGPNNDLYITDSGANAIIKRNSQTKALSVFARIPNVAPTTEAVPTGITYDGQKFLVSGLSGFPFAAGATKIYRVDLAGNVTDYKTGFTTLTDIALSANDKPIAIQYAQFSLTPPIVGFQAKTGLITNGDKITLLNGLDRPTDIEQVGNRLYYVLNSGDGTLLKLTF
ncbi:ScyD/ScyE family protein [Hymenobacter cavernae]|uniref:ScyD/ScyE family protein n=1 Tax=Hymenobacter cavernae TaxID=2044852 RepID=A0ABQ1UYD0_9BACT|nr:ScyD/ScyE family protein [Hymenobacter cavernae]GGF28258.1 hypothetical protein GCM10011383_45010 [Hymenobacter cavernae]